MCYRMSGLVKRYLLSAFVFKSAIIGGGYTTGRELVEFFLSKGPLAGLLGILVSAAAFSVVLVIVFELSRRFQLYDYRTFLKKLLGPGWVLYEFFFLILLVLILSVLGAASGEIVEKWSGLPPLVGTALQMVLVAAVIFYGTRAIERFFAAWFIILYAAFVVFFVWSAMVLGPDIQSRWHASESAHGALSSGVLYAGYSMAVIPTILYCARHFQRTADAVVSGILAGPLAMIPAILFFMALISRYPEVNEQHVPILYMLGELRAPVFSLVFQGVIFGTLVEAGVALIHGFNERLADAVHETGRNMSRTSRAIVAITLMSVSTLLADKVGIVNLIAKGYGYSTYAFLLLIAVPVVTRGLWLILREPVDVGRSAQTV